ncbi:SDR family NAD(P)-dependent oxidoreductase [Actinoplanes sp. CA-252034]|uniref:SDR family NAD(P)-dependent oxidoreductase n=1 Tax=Actinoplanes sp. CA-252034 TaxID=3239906 RepID=UPI003D9654D3
MSDQPDIRPSDIAVIGVHGRFPGADGVDELWRRLCDGDVALRPLTPQELAEVPAARRDDPRFVAVDRSVAGRFRFAHEFFGYSVREGELMDPQHRLFLETAWELLETAGHAGQERDTAIGVFGGASMNTYLTNVVARAVDLLSADGTEVMVTNDKDFLTSRVSYKLDLTGPSITVQTGCSTSLVAVHLAVQSLLAGECDIALAGGASVHVTDQHGYLFQDGLMFSPDGQCRAFAADAAGTSFGDGVGLVALRRLSDALDDGDDVLAVIRGSAVNNDGADKVGYTAPGIAGQRAAIVEAMAVADADPDTIGYVEAHGTGTALGDPVEFTALREAFAAHGTPPATGAVALGTVKANVGHLAAAAGITGLIKAVLAVQHAQIPPHPRFGGPHPALGLADSSFHVNDRLIPWPVTGAPRRAGVSSFGIGGTNAHVVLQQAPPLPPSDPDHAPQILPVSAKTEAALWAAVQRLADHLETHPEIPLADVAYTLQAGRRHFAHRHAEVAADHTTAVRLLRAAAANAGASPAGTGEEHDIARRWISGGSLDAAVLHKGRRRRRVALPGHPLDRRELRLTPAGEAAAGLRRITETSDWVYGETWRRAIGRPRPANRPDGSWLVFAGDDPVSSGLVNALRAWGTTPAVVHPTGGTRPGDLLAAATAGRPGPHHLVYAWPAGHATAGDPAAELCTLLELVQAAPSPATLTVVVSGAFDVLGTEPVVPSRAGLAAAATVIAQEYGGLTCRIVDCDDAVDPRDLLAELTGDAVEQTVALRRGARWTRHFDPVPTADLTAAAPIVRDGGVYLITGGLGGIGLVLAEHLATTRRARLVLTGRSPFPAPAEYDSWTAQHGSGDPVSRRIERVRGLPEVLAVSADVTDATAMAGVVRAARQRFGRIDGWFHAAGVPLEQASQWIGASTAADWQRILAPKVTGAAVLEEVLADDPVDFGCFVSSIAAVAGGAGYAAYAAANAHLDALAQARPGRLSIGWDAWKVPGGPRPRSAAWQRLAEQAITPAEGARVLDLVLRDHRRPHLLVSVTDLMPRLRAAASDPAPTAPTAPAAPVAGTGELRTLLAGIWSEVLRTEVTDHHRSIFELGGDSLLIVQLAARIEAALGRPVRSVDVLAAPTVEQLARHLEGNPQQTMSDERAGAPVRARRPRRTGADDE